jgi:iron(III) transport system permease protein
MVGHALGHGGFSDLGGNFRSSLLSSLRVAAGVGLASFALGLPVGLLAVFYRFTGRSSLLAVIALPLFVPSFLWAIGLTTLRSSLGLAPDGVLDGPVGAIAVFSAMGVPLAAFATMAATASIARHPADAARLAGGERALWTEAVRAASPTAALAAGLAAVLSLSDAGPALILGGTSVATEILTSFAALYDYDLATRQCVALSATVLGVALPVVLLFPGGFRPSVLARDLASVPSVRHAAASWIAPIALALPAAILVGVPSVGLLLPLGTLPPLADTAALALGTLPDTMLYAGGAAIFATLCGFAMAVGVARDHRLRAAMLVLGGVLLCMPPSLFGLAIARAAAASPPALDWMLRSRLTVCAALAVRFLPIALLFGLRSMASLPPSRVQAAAVHGVGIGRYAARVLWPALAPAMLICALTVALLASGEVGLVLLLRPPGEDSLPVMLFTVMANAPEAMVAALCVLYLASAAVPLAVLLPRVVGRGG